MLELSFLKLLRNSERILIAGAGGGFDVFSGLPLFFALTREGRHVSLASLSFAFLEDLATDPLSPDLYRITPETPDPDGYFPEKHLARWLQDHGYPSTIWCIERRGVRPLTKAYEALQREYAFDTILLVDGGTDSLMKGDETSLGTPAEDIASILAATSLPAKVKMLICLGFGVDRFHGVLHAQVLEAIAELTEKGAYHGALSLTLDMPEVTLFREAVEYVQHQTPGRESIVCASIISALEGHFGNYHHTSRTKESSLFINPLLTFYWTFDLDAVARRILYRDRIMNTEDFWELHGIITDFFKHIEKKPHQDIPL